MNSTVYVGNKGVMNYVLAVITQFNTEKAEEVRIKARGRAISRAVDVEELLKNSTNNIIGIDNMYSGTKENLDFIKSIDKNQVIFNKILIY